MFIKHVATGVYGRILLHLTRGTRAGAPVADASSKKDANEEHQESQQQKLRVFSPGDIVGIFQSDRHNNSVEKGSADGIVYKVTNDELVIAFNEMHEFVSQVFARNDSRLIV